MIHLVEVCVCVCVHNNFKLLQISALCLVVTQNVDFKISDEFTCQDHKSRSLATVISYASRVVRLHLRWLYFPVSKH